MSDILQGIPGAPIRILVNPWTEPFWSAAKEGRLAAQRCTKCKAFRMPPGPFCPKCQTAGGEWVTLSGKGELFTYTVCVKSPYPNEIPDFTYAPGVVLLHDADDIHLVGNIVGIRPEEIKIGMTVQIEWEPTGDGWAVPRFRPVPG